MNSRKSQNIFINNALITQIIFILVIISAVFLFERFFSGDSLTRYDSGSEAALFIDLGHTKRMFAGEVIDGMTILDAMNASVTAGKMRLTYYVDGNNNTTVKEINDHAVEGDQQFVFYINSRKIDQDDLNKTPVQAGDEIMIKLE